MYEPIFLIFDSLNLSIRRFILILAYPKNVRCVYVSNALIYGTINGKVENTFNFT